jgi:hypothetical protein
MSYDLYFYTKKNSGVGEHEIADYLNQNLVSASGIDTQWFIQDQNTGAYYSIDLCKPETDPESIETFDSFPEFENSRFSFNLNFLRPDFFGQFAFKFVGDLIAEFDFHVLNPQSKSDPDNPTKTSAAELYEEWANLNKKHSIEFFEEGSFDYYPLEKSNYFYRYSSARSELQNNLGDNFFVPGIFRIKKHSDGSIATLCTWTENIPTVLPKADYFVLSRKVRRWFRETTEAGVVTYQTLMEKFAEFTEDFDFEDCKIVSIPNSERSKAVFDAIQFETDMKSLGEGTTVDTILNAKHGD